MTDASTDTISIPEISEEDMHILVASMREEVKYLLGEKAFIERGEMIVIDSESDNVASMITDEMEKTLALYHRLKKLSDESFPVEDWGHVGPITAPVTVSFVDVESIAVESYVENVLPDVGCRVRYLGEKCALLPGTIYTITDISEQQNGVFISVGEGYYRLDAFNVNLVIEAGDAVRFIGSDGGVGEERYFTVHEITHWGGTPYVTIITKKGDYLAYPMSEFQLSAS